ncbi:hypothetical protein [Leucobacter japonicus]|uniref:hypothetical protein n=1 Tax=Leucobacter japonicus TaxID=1461259 RepID=UPI000A7EEAED|nr:hypothetical protein [Leucobacter japonicus]
MKSKEEIEARIAELRGQRGYADELEEASPGEELGDSVWERESVALTRLIRELEWVVS